MKLSPQSPARSFSFITFAFVLFTSWLLFPARVSAVPLISPMTLSDPNGAAGDRFGTAVAITETETGNVLVVGAPGTTVNENSGTNIVD
jgi:hypothetical protein